MPADEDPTRGSQQQSQQQDAPQQSQDQDQPPDRPDIVVDDDWKDRVRKEREQLRQQEAARRAAEREAERNEASGGASSGGASPDSAQPTRGDSAPDGSQTPESATAESETAESAGPDDSHSPSRLPPASFEVLISTLATQAMSALGLVPGPDGKQEPDLDVARHFIDTLGILEEKTSGNLTEAEAQLLQHVLHDLRLAFVQLS